MTIKIIVLLIGFALATWALLGSIYGLVSKTPPNRLREYPKIVVFLGGPVWWLFYFLMWKD